MKKQTSQKQFAAAISDSDSAANFLREDLNDLDHEESWVLYMNNCNRPLGKLMITVGSIAATIIDHRRIVKQALLCNATRIILFHNHPSGNPLPSKADITETEKLKKACDLFEISLLDHIIIAEDSFYSFADESRKSLR